MMMLVSITRLAVRKEVKKKNKEKHVTGIRHCFIVCCSSGIIDARE